MYHIIDFFKMNDKVTRCSDMVMRSVASHTKAMDDETVETVPSVYARYENEDHTLMSGVFIPTKRTDTAETMAERASQAVKQLIAERAKDLQNPLGENFILIYF